MLLTTPRKAQKKLAENLRLMRLETGLTQEGLAKRSAVPLPTLRRFEQKGAISLEAFLKLQMALGRAEKIVAATEPTKQTFSSIDEVLKSNEKHPRQRGWRK